MKHFFFFFPLEAWTTLSFEGNVIEDAHETNSSPLTQTPETDYLQLFTILSLFFHRGFLGVSKKRGEGRGGSNRMYPDKLTNIGSPAQVTRPRLRSPLYFLLFAAIFKSRVIYFRNSISVEFYFYFTINTHTHIYTE